MHSQVDSSASRGLIDRCLHDSWHKVHGMVKARRVRRKMQPVDVSQATLNLPEQSLLRELVQSVATEPGPIIEIGTLVGATTTRMARWKAPGQRIITVDNYCWNPWRLTPELHHALAAQVLFADVESGHVEQVRLDKAEFYRRYDGPPPALVFLDAWHTYEETRLDIEWAIRAGASLVCGHDYCDEFPGVIQVVREFGGPARLRGSVWSL